MQRTAAAGACLVLDVDDLLDPLEVSGKRAAVGLALPIASIWCVRRFALGPRLAECGLNILETQLQLIGIELLRSLGSRQPHDAVLNPGPAKASLLELLSHQAKPGAVPPDQLHPVRSLRPKHIDHARIGIGAVLLADQRGERVRTLAEIHRARRDHHPRTSAKPNHRVALSASITAAMRFASASRPIFTATPSIFNSTAAVFTRRRRRGRRVESGSAASTTAGTKTGASERGVAKARPSASNCFRRSRRQA